MSFDAKIVSRGLRRHEQLKSENARRTLLRREEAYAKLPALKELDAELRLTVSSVMLAALQKSADLNEITINMKKRSMELQEQRRAMLEEGGCPADYYDEKNLCPKCGDSGYADGKMCSCLISICAEEQRKDLSALLKLGSESFGEFNFDYYDIRPDSVERVSPRERMKNIYDISVGYAKRFGDGSPSFLFTGKPGLGKTYLAACIARVVSEKGFSVVYDTSISILEGFEKVKFKSDGDESAQSQVDRCMNCDLLIMDDLGTEMKTQFTISALYMLINTRLLNGKKTIITTNLTENEIKSKYNPQIASRLLGEYDVFRFLGEDIRVMKKEMQFN